MASTNESRAEFFHGRKAAEFLSEFDPAKSPAHVAIIMDGNGRWAAKRGLPRVAGHRAGARPIRESIVSAIELGVGYLTLYSFSSENWRRPKDEVKSLMSLFIEVLERELKYLEERDVRVRLLGRSEAVPEATLAAFERAEERTAGNKTLTLQIALNYGGRTEILDAAASLARDAASGRLDPADIDEKAFTSRLYAPDVPDPDLLIRTSGELRVSNFLLWEIAYSEIWVTGLLWPDFRRNDFLKAVVDYQRRERRFGG